MTQRLQLLVVDCQPIMKLSGRRGQLVKSGLVAAQLLFEVSRSLFRSWNVLLKYGSVSLAETAYVLGYTNPAIPCGGH
jgi:hypothetical protein